MSEHPKPEILDRFLRGELPSRDREPVLRHLLRSCAHCQAVMEPVAALLLEDELPGDFERELAAALTALDIGAEEAERAGDFYDAALDRAFAAGRREAPRLEREARIADEAHAALVAAGLPGVTARGTRRFRGPALCRALLRRSHDLRYEDPTEMVRFAQLAVLTSGNLDRRIHGDDRVADLQAQAWGELGNAQRITGDLLSAERALARALALFHEGSQDPLLGARLLSLQASLLGDQRRFREALDLLREVEETYGLFGETHQAASAVVKRGIYTGYAGDADEAVTLLRRGLAMVDKEADPQLALAAVHNFAWFVMEAGRPREARAILWRHRLLYERHGERITLLKRLWLQGRIDAALGQLNRAARRVAEALRGFDDAHLGYHAALAALDLSEVLLREGKSKMAAGFVEQAAETFLALGIAREAIGALSLLQQAFEKEVATAAAVQRVAAFFRRLEHEPAAHLHHLRP